MSTLLVVDDMKTIREQYAYDLERKTEHEVLTAENGKDALGKLDDEAIDLVILDLEMPVMDGLEMLETMEKNGPSDVPVIVYTAQGNFQRCVRAVNLGAYNFFDKNEVNLDQLIQVIENALEKRRLMVENKQLKNASGQDSYLIGISDKTKELRETINKIARVPSNVVVSGESGTGKELVAKELHDKSDRAKKPFVALNCAALPENLVESELFGFEKGAFSGAEKTTKGKFEVANGGTLFLDEIGDMPLNIQAKLLRVLQENQVSRLGSEGREIDVDVRVIAATNQDLEEQIENDQFREDLYYRICTHVIQVPPLRERLDDVKPLTLHFVERTCDKFGIPEKTVNPGTFEQLRQYDWSRNNVRELENIVERMIIQCNRNEILPEHIPGDIRKKEAVPSYESGKSFQDLKYQAERQIIISALEEHDWHITNTAKSLDIANHSNLLKIMRRLDIERPE
ncbi:MAG: sigma-54 dependent transcriptional regulator [Candidatus Marinimicrobia bacterium]|nr:sigma-54 dependent transcriptional regulator [Candidatus Neomarinimicrobiota bacterium]MCF7829587.1 sigma-54 dependent transcriptional regulator [Candidatus Neomarinimicrobiota bacterium]MCF7882241.1 sigma-54 dependent transcriptional regulator [Candidatus Neomarinimicrobiota bacterium]